MTCDSSGGVYSRRPATAIRQGSGAFISLSRRARRVLDSVDSARGRAAELIEELRAEGLRDDEIRRVFEAELSRPTEAVRRR